jgi:hypothetical protein
LACTIVVSVFTPIRRERIMLYGGGKYQDEFTISNSSLPVGTKGTTYKASLGVSGGTGPYTYAVTSGQLPAGLSMSNGVISGTPTASATTNFTTQVTDSTGKQVSKQLSITIS